MLKVYKGFVFLILGLAYLCQGTAGSHDLSKNYSYSSALAGEDYKLYWTVDITYNVIRFAIDVRTTGWVGFGLSPNGQMPGSDVVIGWVDGSSNLNFYHVAAMININKVYEIQDMYAETRSVPEVDSSQDWFVTIGKEENGRTILEFNRSLITCDENDMDIMDDTARIIWSYNSQDPLNLEELEQLKHDRKGSASLNLLGGLATERVDQYNSRSFIVVNENVIIPSNKTTTYWCSVHKLPQEIEEQEHYMHKVSPVIFGPTAKYVHHFLAYLCTNVVGNFEEGSGLLESSVMFSQECSSENNIDIRTCTSTGVLFSGWAVGGTGFEFPDGVALPFGGKGRQYIVLEIHYDNPNLDAGMVDNSGLEIHYSFEEPENRAALLTLGQNIASTLVIPPKAENFVVNALCPAQCTNKFFPQDGINIFGDILHTHLAGHALVVRHFRETGSCEGLEELQPIHENRRYDFNYQQASIYRRPVQVLPGDILQLECSYRTTDPAYEHVVLGGESTREEMCFSFLYYYPETELTYCSGYQIVSQEFASQHFPDNVTDLFNAFQADNHQDIENIFNQVNWNSETIDTFQTSVHSNTYFTSCINTTNITSSVINAAQLPEVACPYKPINKCSGSSSVHHHTYFILYCLAFLYL